MRTAATRTAAAVTTIAMGLAAVAGGATAAGAADDTRADIYLELSGPGGTKVFEATDVALGAGPELTEDDVISNPNDLAGGVDVDFNLDRFPSEIYVGSLPDNFDTAEVSIEFTSGEAFAGAAPRDEYFFGSSTALVDWGVTDGVFSGYWDAEGSEDNSQTDTTFWFFLDGALPFDDVTGDDAYREYNEHWLAITALGVDGISNGWSTPDGQEYRPYHRTTRDALATFLYRTFGSDPTLTDEDAPFIDVSSNPDSPHYSEHWEAIYWMAEEGLAAGWSTDEGQEFRPTEQITRDAVASFFFRLSGDDALPASEPFVDVSGDPKSDKYSEHSSAIAWMYEQGFANGWSSPAGPTYRPTAKITRDAVAAFVFRTAMRQQLI